MKTKKTAANHEPPEICVNLWYFLDEQSQLIYLLAGRAYALTGTVQEKLSMLQNLAATDYCVAPTFLVPDHFSVKSGDEAPMKGVIAPMMVRLARGTLFEHVFQGLEKALPVHFCTVAGEPQPRRLTLSQDPLCVTTCVIEYEDGRLEVKAPARGRFSF